MATFSSWSFLNLSNAPRQGETWPQNLYNLELIVSRAASRKSSHPLCIGLTREQMRFVTVVSSFAQQAKDQGRDAEFLAQYYARFFSRWPIRLTLDMPWDLAKKKEHLRLELQWACLERCTPAPPMDWEFLFGLADQDFEIVAKEVLGRGDRCCVEARVQARDPRLRPTFMNVVAGSSSSQASNGFSTTDTLPVVRISQPTVTQVHVNGLVPYQGELEGADRPTKRSRFNSEIDEERFQTL
ncbi:hypothetical protein EST38_g4824 [Candolleomyces aberdarensis]|uniref:Uncharacterized protein n=1 Tax=Candolleomyces aberdarensis TaxID=2316362 RepID=A0A4Q2DPD9_9AGAR|nr:hypothetical protein EST38_g4824 [Candolleomyces aberdarensis]